jgi:hypothetical protein
MVPVAGAFSVLYSLAEPSEFQVPRVQDSTTLFFRIGCAKGRYNDAE